MTEAVKLTCAACGQTNRIAAERLGARAKCGVCGDRLADGSVLALDAKAHDKATRTDDLPLLVDYWAPWCGPCRRMAPEFTRAARALAPRVRLAKLNTEEHPGVARRTAIRGIPALVLYRDGQELGRLAGVRPAADIISFVEAHLGRTRVKV